jgi:hypothetical protein
MLVNLNFTRELEREEINDMREMHPNAEFILLGDMNSCVGALQINLLYIWDTFKNINKECNNHYGRRISKDNVYNADGKNSLNFVKGVLSKF